LLRVYENAGHECESFPASPGFVRYTDDRYDSAGSKTLEQKVTEAVDRLVFLASNLLPSRTVSTKLMISSDTSG
jgi:hypothetical protein